MRGIKCARQLFPRTASKLAEDDTAQVTSIEVLPRTPVQTWVN